MLIILIFNYKTNFLLIFYQFAEEEDFNLNKKKARDTIDAKANLKRIEQEIKNKGKNSSRNNVIHLKSPLNCSEVCEKYSCTKEENRTKRYNCSL